MPVDVVTTRSQAASKLRASGELPAPSTNSNSGEVRELSVSNRVVSMIDDMLSDEQQAATSKPMLQDYKKFKHGKEIPQEAIPETASSDTCSRAPQTCDAHVT